MRIVLGHTQKQNGGSRDTLPGTGLSLPIINQHPDGRFSTLVLEQRGRFISENMSGNNGFCSGEMGMVMQVVMGAVSRWDGLAFFVAVLDTGGTHTTLLSRFTVVCVG